jgi:DNA-binding NarL/FixJ family response regulator
VEDHQIVPEGLASLPSSNQNIEVVGSAPIVREATAPAEDRHPSVVLMDSRLPDGSGGQAAAHIHRQQPEIAILSGYDSDEFCSSPAIGNQTSCE